MTSRAQTVSWVAWIALGVGACSTSTAPLDAAPIDAATDAGVDAAPPRLDGAVDAAPLEDAAGAVDSSTVDAAGDPVAAAIRLRDALQSAVDTVCACAPPLPPYASAAECLAENSWEGAPGECLVREYGIPAQLEYVLCQIPYAETLAECVRGAACDESSVAACFGAFSSGTATCPSAGGPSCMP